MATEHVDVALAPTLRHQAPTGTQCRVQRAEQTIVICDPVEGRRRENYVNRLLQPQLQQVGTANIGVRAEPLASRGDHRVRQVDRDHVSLRNSLDQRFGYTPRAAAGVEYSLISLQIQAFEDPQPHRLHRTGDAVI
jgi:hypothetical protein